MHKHPNPNIEIGLHCNAKASVPE